MSETTDHIVDASQHESSGSPVLDRAWQSYWGDFAQIRRMLYGHPFYDHDEATRTGANHWLHQMLYVGHSLAVQPRQLYPTFYSTVFQFPLHNTYGLPSPDNNFGLALLDGSRRYRIWGKRHSAHSVTIVVHHGFWGDDNPQPMAELQLDDFEIAPDGSFEIIASAEEVPGNWIEIDAASKNVAIIVRHTHNDWEIEQSADMHVERLDIDEDLPGMWLNEAELADRIVTAGRLMLHMARMNDLLPGVVLEATRGSFNTFADLSGPSVAKYGTFNRAHYGNAVFEFGADQALIIEADDPGPDAFYWNFQLGDIWFQTADYVFHQTSLNSSQIVADEDGKIRLVVATTDPAVPNWLDPMGRTFGVVVFRVYGPTSPVQQPTITAVPLFDLRDHLPAATPFIDTETRRVRLRERRIAGARRFGL